MDIIEKIRILIKELKDGKFTENDAKALIDVLEELIKILFFIIKFKK